MIFVNDTVLKPGRFYRVASKFLIIIKNRKEPKNKTWFLSLRSGSVKNIKRNNIRFKR